MEFQELFAKLNDGKLAPPTDKKRWEEASDRISVHAKGIRPAFINPRKGIKGRDGRYTGGQVVPENNEDRYQYLFDNYVLNRHPNEQEEHYEFRKSVYPCITEQIYLEAKAQVTGSIFQNSQYTIAANDEINQRYLNELGFEKKLKEQYFEHILTDPHGKFAIVEAHFQDFGSDEKAQPAIELVESRYIMHFEAGESILFRSSQSVGGKALLYFIDRQYCIKLIQADTRKRTYEFLAGYEHGLGELPVVDNEKYLFKPFVTWADLIGRNFSDDEIVAKNNNHPYIQVVEPVCKECMGSCTVSYPCEVTDNCPEGIREENCRGCKGKGTVSYNPGEMLIIPEKDFRPGDIDGGMHPRLMHINPEVAISKNSFDRCWKIYEAGLKSLHLKHTDEAQSGTAKAIDREQLYLLISNCSNHIFEIADSILRYYFGYLELGISEAKPYTIEQPTQFQIKTESDIQSEMIALAGADLSVRRQKTDEYMQVVYAGNKIELKKWNIVKVWDSLYCMTSDEISTYKLNSAVTVDDVIKHTKIEQLLNLIILEKRAEWFVNSPFSTVIAELESRIAGYLPKTQVEVPADPELIN